MKKGWLDKYGKEDNANDSKVSLPEGFVGIGNNTQGRNYSPAWGGQFQDGGVKRPSFEEYYKTVPQDKNDTTSYSLREAFKELPYSQMKEFANNPNAHLGDTYKLPNHPTFSNESKYSNEKTPGGEWIQLNGKWYFEHSNFTNKHYNRTAEYLNGSGEEPMLPSVTVTPKRKPIGPQQYADGGELPLNPPSILQAPESPEPNYTGMMKARMALASEFGNPTARRMTQMDAKGYTFTGDEGTDEPKGEQGNVYVSSYDNYVTPSIQESNGKLEFVKNPWSKENRQQSREQSIKFERPQDAQYFGEHYKEIAPMMKREWRDGGMVQDMQMGGVLPSAFVRTGDIPSEGKYAKKTIPSAQTGLISHPGGNRNINTNQVTISPRQEYENIQAEKKKQSEVYAFIKKQQEYQKEHSDVYKDPHTGETVIQSIGIQPSASPIDAAVLGVGALYSGGVGLLGSMADLVNPFNLRIKNFDSKITRELTRKEAYEDAINTGFIRGKGQYNDDVYTGKGLFWDKKGNYIIDTKDAINKYPNRKMTIGRDKEPSNFVFKDNIIPTEETDIYRHRGKLPLNYKLVEKLPTSFANGGNIIKDNNGYWNPDNWGHPVEIDSNRITMKNVYEPLIGISDTGDTKYMEPGQDYRFKGKSVTEYPMAQNGFVSTADKEILYDDRSLSPKDFTLKYISSPKYKERLSKWAYTDINNTIKDRTKDVQNTEVYYQNESPNVAQQLKNDLKGIPYSTMGSTAFFPGKIIIDKKQVKELATTSDDVLAHEFAHKELKSGFAPYGKGLDTEDSYQILTHMKPVGRYTEHDLIPSENKADLNAARYELYKQGVDVFKKDFTKEDLNLLKTSKNFTVKRLFKNYEDKDIIWLMNNIAQNKQTSSDVPLALNGINNLDEKTTEHLDQLTNFTNYNKPTVGGWLSKYSQS